MDNIKQTGRGPKNRERKVSGCVCVCFSSLETNKKSNKSQAYDVRSKQTCEANEIRRTNAKLFQNGNKIVNWKPFSDYEQNDSYFTDGKKNAMAIR